MHRKEVRKVVLTSFADVSNGIATAWAFASYDALIRLAWWDLLSSVTLAILSLLLSLSIKLKRYDKHP